MTPWFTSLQTLAEIFRKALQWPTLKSFSLREFLDELFDLGVRSLGIVTICVTFMGIIIVLEYSFHMRLVLNDDGLVPGFAMILLVRELAPIVTALLLTSKNGASIAAELASMKNTEQIDAYRLLGVDIIENFVSPKVLSGALSTWALAMLSLGIAIFGSLFAAITFLSFTVGTFTQSMTAFIEIHDLGLLSVKSLVFGMTFPAVSALKGLEAQFGAEGVGKAATDAVVACSIIIIVEDFLVTYAYSLF
jgi:phospholipid/cholesterol/gamma-HCH transport system permease protein